MHFMTAGDQGYAFLIRENCTQVRALYPDAPILVYDYGLTDAQRTDFEQSFQPLTVIDWRDQLDALPDSWKIMDEAQKRKLALAYNARKTGWKKRLRKTFFKRFPNSGFANRLKDTAIRYENLMVQKIAIIRDASVRAADDTLVYLDADAMVFKPIDDAFSDDADITVTLLNKQSWEHNACFIFNAGVIYFNADTAARNRFIDAWWEGAERNDEWLREQSALVRLVESQTPREAFVPGKNTTLTLDGAPVRVRFEACDDYNFFDMENIEPEDFPDSRVYHFTGRRQQPAMFHDIMAYLRRHRGATP